MTQLPPVASSPSQPAVLDNLLTSMKFVLRGMGMLRVNLANKNNKVTRRRRRFLWGPGYLTYLLQPLFSTLDVRLHLLCTQLVATQWWNVIRSIGTNLRHSFDAIFSFSATTPSEGNVILFTIRKFCIYSLLKAQIFTVPAKLKEPPRLWVQE